MTDLVHYIIALSPYKYDCLRLWVNKYIYSKKYLWIYYILSIYKSGKFLAYFLIHRQLFWSYYLSLWGLSSIYYRQLIIVHNLWSYYILTFKCPNFVINSQFIVVLIEASSTHLIFKSRWRPECFLSGILW